MKRFSLTVWMALFFSGLSPMVRGQQPQNESVEVERMRIQAQERARQEIEQKDWETKLFQVRYVDPTELSRALSLFRVSVNYSGGNLRVLSVRAPKEIMPAIEDAIKRLDVPMTRKDAELIISVLLASDQPATTTLPSGLQPVVNQLRNILAYKGYQLVDTLIARGRDTNNATATALQGTLKLDQAPFPGNITYSFRASFGIMNPDGKETVLRLNSMRFILTVPIDAQGRVTNLEINTDVEIPVGQQVVVGKATYNDRAFILVMNARL
jgi:hypothetical protein